MQGNQKWRRLKCAEEMCIRSRNVAPKLSAERLTCYEAKGNLRQVRFFLAKKKNTVVFSDDWASNTSKQNSSARRFSTSSRRLKCDSQYCPLPPLLVKEYQRLEYYSKGSILLFFSVGGQSCYIRNLLFGNIGSSNVFCCLSIDFQF